MVRAAQKLLKLHQSGEVTIGDLLPEIKSLANGDTGFTPTILSADVMFTYNNKDYAIQWIANEFAVVGNIATNLLLINNSSNNHFSSPDQNK